VSRPADDELVGQPPGRRSRRAPEGNRTTGVENLERAEDPKLQHVSFRNRVHPYLKGGGERE
jgi:hypothetical protein